MKAASLKKTSDPEFTPHTTANAPHEEAKTERPTRRSKKSKAEKPLDPLFIIFEQHLLNFQDSDSDRKTFIHNIVGEYLTYLRKMNIVVPRSLEQPIIEELSTQVNTMLVKKIYGCLSIDDYRKGSSGIEKKRARQSYKKLDARRALTKI